MFCKTAFLFYTLAPIPRDTLTWIRYFRKLYTMQSVLLRGSHTYVLHVTINYSHVRLILSHGVLGFGGMLSGVEC